MSSIWDWSKIAANNATSDTLINWAEGMPPSAVNNSARQLEARVAEYLGDTAGALTAGGTANAQTVTANSAFTAYANGLVIALKIATSNTTAATLNVNGLGAKSIRKMTGGGEVALSGGELQATGISLLMYSTALNAAAGGWLLLNPSTIDGTTGTFSGTVTAGTSFLSSSVNVVLANNGSSGAIFFRPNGSASTTGQVSLLSSGIMRFPTGTVAAPSIVDEANSDMGIYFPADASIAFGIDGTHIGRFSADAIHVSKTAGSLATTGHSIFTSGLFQCVRDHATVGQFNVINPVGTETVLEFMTSGTARGSVTINGSTTAYNTTSDRRLKENPRSFDAGAILDKLKVYHFDWKSGGSGYGVFAQEAIKVFPDPVTKGKGKTPWQVDYSKYVPLLLQEVKNLRSEIAKLKG